jgi:putative resolvase
MSYLKLREAVQVTGLHPNTLRKYADEGQSLLFVLHQTNVYSTIDAFVGKQSQSEIVLYARVSSRKRAMTWNIKLLTLDRKN